MVWYLCATDDNQAFISIKIGNTDMRLQHGMGDKGDMVLTFDNDVGFAHSGCEIATLKFFVCGDVVRGIIDFAKIFAGIRMGDRRYRSLWFARTQCLEWVKDNRKYIILIIS